MYIDDFLSLPHIEDKLAWKHSLTIDEVEEVFFNQPRYRSVESGVRPGEDVYSAYGQTYSGRYLVIFFIHKAGNVAFVISARDMEGSERRLYGRK